MLASLSNLIDNTSLAIAAIRLIYLVDCRRMLLIAAIAKLVLSLRLEWDASISVVMVLVMMIVAT